MEARGNKKQDLVSASKAGRAAFCPRALELEHKGISPSKAAVSARARGEHKHERFNELAQDKRCYVASYLYGVDDPRTQALRQFRDQRLLPHAAGRLLIQLYYTASPLLVKIAQQYPSVRGIFAAPVEFALRRIRRNGREC